MLRSRVPVLLVVVLALLLLTTACAPGAPGQVPEVAITALDRAAEMLPQITLPRLVVTYDEAGVPSVFGIKTTLIQPLIPVDLSFLNLPQSYIDWFMRSNVQHIEIDNTGQGLFLYANGQALPYLAWDEDTLKNTAELLGMLGVQGGPIINRALPLVRRLGLDLVLQLPVAAGNEAIPLRPREEVATAEAVAGAPSAVIHLAAQYDAEGVPTIAGLTTRQLGALTGADLSFLELPAATLSLLKAMNVQSLEVRTQSDGLRVAVNDMQLPRLAYSADHLNNAVDLFAQLFPAQAPVAQFLRPILGIVQSADIDLAVELP